MSNNKLTVENWVKILRDVLDIVSPILVFGPTGTSKSTACMKAAVETGRPVYKIQCTPDTDRSAIIGSMGIRDGNTIHLDGPAVLAMRAGGVLVLEEIDRLERAADSDVQAVMDDLLNMQIIDTHGQPVKPKEGFRVLATTNANNPLDSMSAAVADRFRVVIPALFPCEEAMATLEERERTLVASHYKHSAKNWSWSAGLSFRRVLAFQKLKSSVGEETAAVLTFGNGANEFLSQLASASNNS